MNKTNQILTLGSICDINIPEILKSKPLLDSNSSNFLICTLNLQQLRLIGNDSDFFRAYSQNTRIVADGVPITWLHRMFFRKVCVRTAGVDLVDDIMKSPRSVLILGSNSKVFATIIEKYSEYDRNCANTHLEDDLFSASGIPLKGLENLAKRIEELCPDIVLLALGSPKQEFVYRELERVLRPSGLIFIGIGGSFDILSGNYSRAPQILQRSGFEWLWRALQDPVRLFPRYLRDGQSFLKLALWRLKWRREHH